MCVCVCVLGSGRSEIALHQGKRRPRDVDVKAMEGLDNWESNVMKKIGENGVKNAGERLSFSSLIVGSKFLEKKKSWEKPIKLPMLIQGTVGDGVKTKVTL